MVWHLTISTNAVEKWVSIWYVFISKGEIQESPLNPEKWWQKIIVKMNGHGLQ